MKYFFNPWNANSRTLLTYFATKPPNTIDGWPQANQKGADILPVFLARKYCATETASIFNETS